MANYLLRAVGDDIPATTRGISVALRMAQKHCCDLVLLAPSIKNAQDSNMLEEILGKDLLNKLAKKRDTVQIDGVNVRIEALSTFKGYQLSGFTGVILGLWTSKYDAITIAESKSAAKEIILIQWIDGELDKWAEYNKAKNL